MFPKRPCARTGKARRPGFPAAGMKGLALMGAVTLGFGGATFAAAAPASADPALQFIAVGADITENLMDYFAGQVGGGILGSYDSLNPVTQIANETVTAGVAQGGGRQQDCSFTRPNGGVAGFFALDYSYNPSTTLAQSAIPPGQGCLAIAGSARGPGVVGNGIVASSGPGSVLATGNFVFVPFAIDAITYATGPTGLLFTATSASPAVFTAPGSSYAAGTEVGLFGTSLPGGFTAGTGYFVVNPTASGFELAATSGGAALASTSVGSGTVQVAQTTQCNGPTTPAGYTCSSTTGAGTVTFVPAPTSVSQTVDFSVAQLQTLYGSCMPVNVGGTTYNPGSQFAFTATNASPAVFSATGSNLTAGSIVTLSGTGLPGGFAAGTNYYVAAPTTDTFELAATSGGSALASNSAGSGNVTALGNIDLYAPQASGTLLFWEPTMGVTAPQSCWHQTIMAGPATGLAVDQHDGTAVASDPNGIEPTEIPKWIAMNNGLISPDIRHGDILQPITVGGTPVPPVNSNDYLNVGMPGSPGCGATPIIQARCFPITRELYNAMDYYEVVNTPPLSGEINNPPYNATLAGLFSGTASSLCQSEFTILFQGFGLLPDPAGPVFPDTCGSTAGSLRVEMNNLAAQG